MGYFTRQLDEVKSYRWGYFSRKLEKFRYINPLAGLLFTIRNKDYETENCKFVIPKQLTSITYRARYYYDIYENEERQLVNQFVRADDRVIEIGAGIGVVSCITNRILTAHPDRHVAVEPNTDLLPFLQANKEANDCSFHIVPCLISDQTDVPFFKSNHYSKGSAHEESGVTVSVTARRLPDLEQEYGEFNVLIMDIQGGEKELLQLEKEALQHFRLVVAELHPEIIGDDAVQDCRDILTELGFSLRKRISTVEAWEKL